LNSEKRERERERKMEKVSNLNFKTISFVALVSESVLSKLSLTKKQGVLLHPVYLVLYRYYSYSQTMKQY